MFKGISRIYLLSFLWGIAEATLFFIVPDVLISYAAFQFGAKRSFPTIFAATIGALLGVSVMYYWGQSNSLSVITAIDFVPGISTRIISQARDSLLSQSLPYVLIKAGFTGVPIKIFAAMAPSLNIAALPFLLYTMVARVLRFFVAWSAASFFLKISNDYVKINRFYILTLFWVVFYIGYFLKN